MKKIISAIIFTILTMCFCYAYEPTYPSEYFADFLAQIENVLNGKIQNVNDIPCVIIEYEGEDSPVFDITDKNIKKIYLAENDKIEELPYNKREVYKAIKKIQNKKIAGLKITLIYFKQDSENIYFVFEDTRYYVHYTVKAKVKDDGNKKIISEIPEMFNKWKFFKTGLTVYSKWYQ